MRKKLNFNLALTCLLVFGATNVAAQNVAVKVAAQKDTKNVQQNLQQKETEADRQKVQSEKAQTLTKEVERAEHAAPTLVGNNRAAEQPERSTDRIEKAKATVKQSPSGPKRVQNPHRTRQTDGQGNRVVINPAVGRVVINNLTALPDVQSGQRQAIVQFSSPAPITHFRAVQVTVNNKEDPLKGVPWQAYPGGSVKVGLNGCTPLFKGQHQEQIAVQLRGQNIPNPRMAGNDMANVSGISSVILDIPPALRPRIKSAYKIELSNTVGEIDLANSGHCPPHYQACRIRPLSWTSPDFSTLALQFENVPGTQPPKVAIGPRERRCVRPIWISSNNHGTLKHPVVYIDHQTNYPSGSECDGQKIELGYCGSAPFMEVDVPARFYLEEHVIEDTAVLTHDFDIESSCAVTSEAGDLTVTHTEGAHCGAHLVPKWSNRGKSYDLDWRFKTSGQCLLNQTSPLPDNWWCAIPTPSLTHAMLCSMYAYPPLLYHDGYTTSDATQVTPKDLSSSVSLNKPVSLSLSCPLGNQKGRVKSWISRARVFERKLEQLN